MQILQSETLEFWRIIMNQYKSIAQLKDKAKDTLTGKYGNAALLELSRNAFIISITFLFNMVFSVLVINIPFFSGESGSIAGYVFSCGIDFLCSVVTGVLNTGVVLFFLNVACNRPCHSSNLLYGYFFLFKKSVTISACFALIESVCLLPLDIFYYQHELTGSTETMIAMCVSLLLGVIVYIPFYLALSQSYFLLLDFPDYSAGEVMALSARLMKGRKWKFFLIHLSFLPLLLLEALTLGVGSLWIGPYQNMVKTLYFLDIMKPRDTQEA